MFRSQDSNLKPDTGSLIRPNAPLSVAGSVNPESTPKQAFGGCGQPLKREVLPPGRQSWDMPQEKRCIASDDDDGTVIVSDVLTGSAHDGLHSPNGPAIHPRKNGVPCVGPDRSNKCVPQVHQRQLSCVSV